MIFKDFYWFESWWVKVRLSMERRPSALLLVGPKGAEKARFGVDIAASWLCEKPLVDGSACGSCQSCNWIKAGQHPDFRWIRPDAEQEDDALIEDAGVGDSGESDSVASGADSKKKSEEIRIEQIRALAAFANVGSHRGGLRIALISPANRMNYAAANALLKTLEEPPPSLVFILVADTLRAIPATILSRCRRIDLSIDPITLAELQTRESQATEWLLPLLCGDVVDPIRWAEKAGKSPAGDALELLMRWMVDAERVRNGMPARAFPEREKALTEQALRMKSPQNWAQTLAEIQRLRATADHPLNPKLFYESVFDRYRRALV